MPQIPFTQQGISLDVPGMSVQAGTQTNRAIANIGAELANTSLGLAEDVRRAEAISQSSSAALKHSFETEDYIHQLTQQYPTGYVTDPSGSPVKSPNGELRTITHEYQDWSSKKFIEGQDSMGSDLAQEIYREKAKGIFYKGLSDVRNTEMISRTDTFLNNMNQSLTLTMNGQIDKPNPASAYQRQNDLIEQLTAQKPILRISNDQYAARVQMIQKAIPDSVLNGYEALARSNPKKGDGSSARLDYIELGLKLLKGEDADSIIRKQNNLPTFTETMNPENKAAWLDKFENMRQAVLEADAADWRRRVSIWKHRLQNLATQANSTKEEVSPVELAGALREGEALNKKQVLSDEEFLDTYMPVVTLLKARPLLSSPEFLLSNPEKKDQLIEGALQDSYNEMMKFVPQDRVENFKQFDIHTRERLRQEVSRLSEQLYKKAQEDPVAFSQIHRGVKTATAALKFSEPTDLENPAKAEAFATRSHLIDQIYKENYGTSAPSYLSKSEAEAIANRLKGKPATLPYTTIQRNLKALHAADPSKFSQNVEQIIEAGSLNPAWNVALFYSRPDLAPLTDEWIEAIMNNGQFVNADATLKARGSSIDILKGEIEKQAQPYFANLMLKPAAQINRYEHEAMVNTIFNMTMKKVTLGDYPDAALKETVNQIKKVTYADINIGGNLFFGNEKNLAPPYINGRQITDTDKTNLERNLTEIRSKLADIKPDVPTQLDKDLVPKWNEFLSDSSNIRFHFNPRRNVYNILWRDTSRGQWYMLTKKQQVIEMDAADLMDRPPTPNTKEKLQKKATEAASTIKDKAKGAGKAAKKLLESNTGYQGYF